MTKTFIKKITALVLSVTLFFSAANMLVYAAPTIKPVRSYLTLLGSSELGKSGAEETPPESKASPETEPKEKEPKKIKKIRPRGIVHKVELDDKIFIEYSPILGNNDQTVPNAPYVFVDGSDIVFDLHNGEFAFTRITNSGKLGKVAMTLYDQNGAIAEIEDDNEIGKADIIDYNVLIGDLVAAALDQSGVTVNTSYGEYSVNMAKYRTNSNNNVGADNFLLIFNFDKVDNSISINNPHNPTTATHGIVAKHPKHATANVTVGISNSNGISFYDENISGNGTDNNGNYEFDIDLEALNLPDGIYTITATATSETQHGTPLKDVSTETFYVVHPLSKIDGVSTNNTKPQNDTDYNALPALDPTSVSIGGKHGEVITGVYGTKVTYNIYKKDGTLVKDGNLGTAATDASFADKLVGLDYGDYYLEVIDTAIGTNETHKSYAKFTIREPKGTVVVEYWSEDANGVRTPYSGAPSITESGTPGSEYQTNGTIMDPKDDLFAVELWENGVLSKTLPLADYLAHYPADQTSITVKYVYKEKGEVKVSHKFFDEDGNPVSLPDITSSSKDFVGKNYQTSPLSPGEIPPGYELHVTPTNKEGIFGSGVTEVVYEYRQVRSTIIVKHEYEDGTEIQAPDTTKDIPGESHTSTSLSGYTLSKVFVDTTDMGTVSTVTTTYPPKNETKTIVYKYKRPGKVTVSHKFYDKNGNPIPATEQPTITEAIDGYVGERYKTEPLGSAGKPSIPRGYEIYEVPTSPNGIISNTSTDIVYKYRQVRSTIIVKHIYTDGIVIKGEESTEGIPEDPFESKRLPGYELTRVDINNQDHGNAVDISTVFPAKDTMLTITYVYKKPGKVDVTHNFYDENGNPIDPTEQPSITNTINGYVGDNYTTAPLGTPGQPKVPYGYELYEDPADPTIPNGTISDTPGNVVYKYRKVRSTIIVEHVYTDGRALQAPETSVGIPTEAHYSSSLPGHILTQILVDDVDTGNTNNVDTTFPAKSTTKVIRYVYQIPTTDKGQVIIDHVIRTADGRTIIYREIVEPWQQVGINYTTVPTKIPGYKVNIVPTNQNGTVAPGTTTVIYEYVIDSEMAALIVRHILLDENGAEMGYIIDPVVTTGYDRQPYPKQLPITPPDGYQLAADKYPMNDEGVYLIGKEQIVTFYYDPIPTSPPDKPDPPDPPVKPDPPTTGGGGGSTGGGSSSGGSNQVDRDSPIRYPEVETKLREGSVSGTKNTRSERDKLTNPTSPPNRNNNPATGR